MITLIFGFTLCTAVIFLAGVRLSFYGDVIAEKTKLGRTWIGLILVASVTSLPEVINSVSAVVYVDAPDLAAGDLIGSCAFNLSIIVFLDLFYREKSIATFFHPGHIISGSFGILQLSLFLLAIFLGKNMSQFGWIGLNSIFSVIVYFWAMNLNYRYEKKSNCFSPTMW
ncbi:MAG: hypothetical protein N3A65_00350 [candidate division WOR-3 bacterium]|nr:hypothetical protein [candidate division WOR-3 bacterium]